LTTGDVNVAGAESTTWVVLVTDAMVDPGSTPEPDTLNPTSAAVKFPDGDVNVVDPGAPDASSKRRAWPFSNVRTSPALMAATVGRDRDATPAPFTRFTNVPAAIP
jgi:hypothetical protein